MTPANDNAQPFTVAHCAPPPVPLNEMIVKLGRSLEPKLALRDWVVTYGVDKADGSATATLKHRRATRRAK
jgi:hypothetical protein